ncbi:MAG TPA: signal peptidase II, partial [Kribbella sp.]|uniref:signal peptidase II n=1 Tax=Kribbella sp. TaxID=1871183 RepID=UPI002D7930C7
MSGTSRPDRSGAASPAARRRRSVFVLAAALAAVDLTAKALAHNNGVAFSLGNALPSAVVIGFTAVVTIGLLVYAWRATPRVGRWAGVAGALANLLDRAPDGVVTDYLHTGWWPTFNRPT